MNQFQEIFDKQKAYFDSDATKSYEWRIDQLTRLENLCNENAEALEAAMSSDFKTASQEKVFEIMAPVGTAAFAKQELKEWMKPVDVVVPKALRESGHTAKVYREPYGVTLVIGPFNGPLTLLFDPACQVLAAGNPCILKLSEGLPATSKVLLDLIPKYFDPRAVTAVTGSKDEVTELLKLPFDFIFFTGSVKVGKIVMEAAAKNLTPVLLELGGPEPSLSLTRPQISRMQPRRLSGVRRPGAANGAPRPDTPTCTNQSQRSLLRSARRRWSSCTGPTPRADRTTTPALSAQRPPNVWRA
jgi:aldehyde dehydrogenase (NAD+)